MRVKTKDIFIIDANKRHGNKYDYAKVNYINNKIHVKIKCNKHGYFNQTPSNHLLGSGCDKCSIEISGNKKRFNNDMFIEKSRIKNNNKYTYNNTKYINNRTFVIITCPIHGDFNQMAGGHLSGYGCKRCSIDKLKMSIEDFINSSKIKHNNKYDYSLVKFDSSKDKVKIICPVHGVFKQIVNSHLMGFGCNKCGGSKKLNSKTFINRSVKIHKYKYDYSLVDYINNNTNVKIVCKKHGVFNQMPLNHLKGQDCPKCKSYKNEAKIKEYLENSKIKFIYQKSFSDCINPKTKWKLRFDFYIPTKNICIEYDGCQHYFPVSFFGGEKSFNNLKYLDEIKNKYFENNNIKLIRIPYNTNIIESLKSNNIT